jgi:hypothetical protein
VTPSSLVYLLTSSEFDSTLDQQFMPQPSPGLSSSGQLTPNLYNEPMTMPMPMYARSISSSPPRGSLTPEQRELKRQRDSARRDSKNQMRRERSLSNTSNPYNVSQQGSPDLMPRALDYSNSLTPSPLLSQGTLQSSPAMGNTSFLGSYSPDLNGQGLTQQPTPDMYGPMFPM